MDDFLVFSPSKGKIGSVFSFLKRDFKLEDGDNFDKYLGIENPPEAALPRQETYRLDSRYGQGKCKV